MWLRHLRRYSFSTVQNKIYSIPKQVKDVVKLRGLGQQKPYFIIEGTSIPMTPDTFVGNIKIPNSNVNLKFYDSSFNIFYLGTPVFRLLGDTFFVQIMDDLYCVLNNTPLIPIPTSSVFTQTEGSRYVQPVIKDAIVELQKWSHIQREGLHHLLMKSIIDSSGEIKLQKLMFKELMKVVEDKIKIFQENIAIAENKLKASASKRVKLFTSVLIAQAALLHYFIYFNLSWDIMEPITVILANIDLCVAYFYFIIKGKQYSPETLQNSMIESRKFRHLKKQGIDVNKYEQLLQIRDYLRLRSNLLSKSPLVVLETAQKPLRLLDLR